MSVQMISKYARLTPTQISQLESTLGVVFPARYRTFLSTYNVAVPGRNQFNAEEIVTSVTLFYGVSKTEIEDLLATNDSYSGRLPQNVLAIAEAAGGNLICLDLINGEVYWWDHEEEASDDKEPSFENMYFLASSFADFVHQLGARKPLTARNLMGTMPPDDDIANRNAGLEATPEGYTWHHVEDGETMQLLPTDVHRTFQHSGGGVKLRAGNEEQA